MWWGLQKRRSKKKRRSKASSQQSPAPSPPSHHSPEASAYFGDAHSVPRLWLPQRPKNSGGGAATPADKGNSGSTGTARRLHMGVPQRLEEKERGLRQLMGQASGSTLWQPVATECSTGLPSTGGRMSTAAVRAHEQKVDFSPMKGAADVAKLTKSTSGTSLALLQEPTTAAGASQSTLLAEVPTLVAITLDLIYMQLHAIPSLAGLPGHLAQQLLDRARQEHQLTPALLAKLQGCQASELHLKHGAMDWMELVYTFPLHTLTLHECQGVTDQVWSALGQGQGHGSPLPYTLRRLELVECRFVTHHGLAAIAQFTSLRALTLRDMDVNNNVLQYVFAFCVSWQWLHLMNGSSLGRSFSALKSLASLDLSGCTKISNAGLKGIAGLTTLTSLDLSRCPRMTTTGRRVRPLRRGR